MLSWLRERQGRLALVVVAGVVGGLGLVDAAYAGVNLLVNPDLEAIGGGGFPTCWETSGWGDNTFAYTLTNQAHSGDKAMALSVSTISSGDRKMMMAENAGCAPTVTPGHQYDLGVWYTSTSPDAVITAFRHDVTAGWQYWTDLNNLSATTSWTQASVRTPQIPPDTDQITWGVTLYGAGTLVTDDYSMVDATQPADGTVCTAGAACTQGVWQVMPANSPVRGIHAVVLKNGKVLIVAGSGNDPNEFAAGTFTSAVYDPSNGIVTSASPRRQTCSAPDTSSCPTAGCSILGGNKAYPDCRPTGTRG